MESGFEAAFSDEGLFKLRPSEENKRIAIEAIQRGESVIFNVALSTGTKVFYPREGKLFMVHAGTGFKK